MISSTMRRRSTVAPSPVFSKRLNNRSTVRWSSFRSEMASMGAKCAPGAPRACGSARRHLVAQLALEDLAGRVAGQLAVEDEHPARHLERGQALADVPLQGLDGQRGARPWVHGGGHLLAQALVGHTEDGGLVHRGMLVDGGLHLGAVDVLSPAQDHVLGAVLDVDEALVVDAADVTGAEPAVDDRLVGGVGTVPEAADEVGALE